MDYDWTLETRLCEDCKHFRQPTMFAFPFCKRKLMAVTTTMNAYYLKSEGSCFEISVKSQQTTTQPTCADCEHTYTEGECNCALKNTNDKECK